MPYDTPTAQSITSIDVTRRTRRESFGTYAHTHMRLTTHVFFARQVSARARLPVRMRWRIWIQAHDIHSISIRPRVREGMGGCSQPESGGRYDTYERCETRARLSPPGPHSISTISIAIRGSHARRTACTWETACGGFFFWWARSRCHDKGTGPKNNTPEPNR